MYTDYPQRIMDVNFGDDQNIYLMFFGMESTSGGIKWLKIGKISIDGVKNNVAGMNRGTFWDVAPSSSVTKFLSGILLTPPSTDDFLAVGFSKSMFFR